MMVSLGDRLELVSIIFRYYKTCSITLSCGSTPSSLSSGYTTCVPNGNKGWIIRTAVVRQYVCVCMYVCMYVCICMITHLRRSRKISKRIQYSKMNYGCIDKLNYSKYAWAYILDTYSAPLLKWYLPGTTWLCHFRFSLTTSSMDRDGPLSSRSLTNMRIFIHTYIHTYIHTRGLTHIVP